MRRVRSTRFAVAARRRSPHHRRGSVLLVVLVIVLLLTFGVYGFTERMLAEKAAASAHGSAAQARASADSGVALAASLVDAGNLDPAAPPPLYHEPGAFRGVTLAGVPGQPGASRFTVFAPVVTDPAGRLIRHGLTDESGKWDVNGLLDLKRNGETLTPEEQRNLLLGLPGMTRDIADAILDYVDADSEPRTYGAEADAYAALQPPRLPRDGPLTSIDELLLVRGVTPQLLYGEDANRNGLLDPAENDGPATAPADNADGVLNRGWTGSLTVHGGEPNLRGDGTPKIDLNDGILTDLFDALEEEFDAEIATFVVAYRLAGPTDPENSADTVDATTDVPSDEEPTEDEAAARAGPSESEEKQIDEAAGALAKLLGGNTEGAVTRAGMDLSGGAEFDLGSFYDLVGREVEVEIEGQKTTLSSPFQSSGLLDALPDILDRVTVFDTSLIRGRVNVNQASEAVLLGIPGMPAELPAQIAGTPMIGPGGEARGDLWAARRTPFWLVAEGLCDLPTLRRLDAFLTCRGGFFRVQSVGYTDGGGPAVRVEAVIDGTTVPARVVEMRDLSDLGRGVPRAILDGP